MRFSHFFIDRPIFAGVISIMLTLIGVIALRSLPITEYPDIAPPTIEVAAVYNGAAAEVLADAVAAPIEQEINGVDNMIYMVSQATGNGALSIQVVFKPGTDIDQAQVLVQNRVAIATPRLPEDVQRLGITVKKKSPDLMMVVHLISPDNTLDQQYISNYATINVKDVLTRVDGVGDIIVFGARDHSMRIWLDPAKVQSRGLMASDVVAALRANNISVAAGAINQPPARSPRRLRSRRGNARAAVHPGAVRRDRGCDRRRRPGDPCPRHRAGRARRPGLQIQRLPRRQSRHRHRRIPAARLECAGDREARDRHHGRAREKLPPRAQLPDCLQHNRIHPAIGRRGGENAVRGRDPGRDRDDRVPPDLARGGHPDHRHPGVADRHVLRHGGIRLFAEQPDAVRPGARDRHRGGRRHRRRRERRTLSRGRDEPPGGRAQDDGRGRRRAGRHRTGAVRRIHSCRLHQRHFCGAFYRQFALAIASATVISMIISLTLSPALAALLLRPRSHEPPSGALATLARPLNVFFGAFNRGFTRMSSGYGALTRRVLRVSVLMLVAYAGLIGFTYFQFSRTPSGFIPELDRGYFITAITLPPGSSLERTDRVVRKAAEILKKRPGVANLVIFSGFDGATFTNAPNSGVIFATLKPFAEREKGLTTTGILNDLRGQMQTLREAFILVIPPPSVPGIGTGGGFKMYVQDRAGRGPRALEQAVGTVLGQANRTPGLTQVFTLFNASTPRIYADIDRTKAEMLNVPITRVFDTLSTYMGSAYINDFNILGRTYRVYAQADNPFRLSVRDVENLRTRSTSNEVVPIGSVATFRDTTGPYRVPRYNLYPAAEVQGSTLPGFSTGQAIAAMEKITANLPTGFGFEWTEIALQEKAAGNTAAVAFGLAVVFVFLLLAAQYESVLLPLAVILIVPMCLFAAISGVVLRGMDNNILTQIGFVVLIGLAAKNAILIVEFAKQGEERGENRWDAVVEAARTRLRPILMTSFAFIFGVVPLAIATGAGAEMRQALGTAVFFGMLGVTLFGLLFTPVFYVVVRWMGERLGGRSTPQSSTSPSTPAARPD